MSESNGWDTAMTKCGPWFKIPDWKTKDLSEMEIQALYIGYGYVLGALHGVRQVIHDPDHAPTLATQYSDCCMGLPEIEKITWPNAR